jgi:anti-sigma factor RsiW
MELDRDTLNRFVDGELPPKEMEDIAAKLAGDQELNAYVARHENLRNQLRDRFRALDGSMPEQLIETVRTAPVSWQWRLRAALAPNRPLRWLAPACAALVLGFVAGTSLWPAKNDFGTGASGQLVAQGALGKALDSQLASEGNSGPVRIGISFRNKAGQACRIFNSGSTAGLACHSAGTWVVGMLVKQAAPEDAGAAYRMVGSEMPDAVRRAVTSSISGEPFDAAAESRAARDGWPQIKVPDHASGH